MTARSTTEVVDVLLDRHGWTFASEAGIRLARNTLRDEAGRHPDDEHRLLTAFTGIGDLGADIFLREVQLVWDELVPHIDARTLSVAERQSLPTTATGLRQMVPDTAEDTATFVRLVAALVRCGLADDHERILDEAACS